MTRATQPERAMGHLKVPWDGNVLDPRDARGRRHGHHGLLNALVMALASGQHTLRAVESLVEDVSPRARRKLGLPSGLRRSLRPCWHGSPAFRQEAENRVKAGTDARCIDEGTTNQVNYQTPGTNKKPHPGLHPDPPSVGVLRGSE